MSEQDFGREVIERLTRIEGRIENLDNYKSQVYKNKDELLLLKQRTEKCEKDLNALHENNRWLKRTTIAAVISAVATAIVSIAFSFL